MTLFRMFDAAYPPDQPYPDSSAAAGYIGYRGGDIDTPHLWTLDEWNAATGNGELRSLPIWMPDYSGDPVAQGDLAVSRAVAFGWKPHHARRRVIALDMEARVLPEFVTEFARRVHGGGFGCWVYGSAGFVFGNPPCDGYWVAAYPGNPGVGGYPGEHVVAHQVQPNVAWSGTEVDLGVVTGAALEHLGKGPRRQVTP